MKKVILYKKSQLELNLSTNKKYSREKILDSIYKLQKMHKKGLLGGEIMPEDSNPNLQRYSSENYHYFTLPMALNFQRNSYMLWRAAKQTYNDVNTRKVFYPEKVVKMDKNKIRNALIKYKLALQPHKHTEIWKKICDSIISYYKGDIRNLFIENQGYIPKILLLVQKKYKSGFPYLSGPKICNYWLYVIDRYTDAKLTGREALTIAPDTHVIQASVKLGLIDYKQLSHQDIRNIVSKAWQEILNGTGILPIDIHTPLWLWSRNGFISIID